MRHKRYGRLATLAIVGLLAACETGFEPEAEVTLDTQAALADYQAVEAVLQSTGWAGFQALGNRTPFAGSAAGVETVGSIRKVAGEEDARSFALGLARRLTAPATSPVASRAPIISDLHRGKTFVYEPATDDYVVDPDRTGAPATGVRFIIYAVDGTGTPIAGEEIGYADLIDEGDNSARDIVLRLTVVENGTTVLDYRTSVDTNADRGTLTVDGFLRGDGNRLDFSIEATGSESGGRSTLDVSFEMRVDARDFRITGSVRGIEEGSEGEGDIEVTVRHRDQSLRVDVRGDDHHIDGSVFLNGGLFATVSGDEDDPTFLGATGEPLTGLEYLVLWRVLDVIEDVFDFLEDLVDPVDDLILLGVVL